MLLALTDMADAVLHTITKCVADFVVLVMAAVNYDLFHYFKVTVMVSFSLVF